MVWGAGAGRLPVCRSFRVPAKASKESRRRIPWWSTCQLPFWGPDPVRTGPRANDERRLGTLVEEFVNRRADFLEPFRVLDGEVGRSDIPGAGGDLVLCDVVLHRGATDTRPAFTVAEHHVELIGNMCGEVVDIRVPVPVIC